MKKYPYRLREISVEMDFISIGPKGRIVKVVEYSNLDENDASVVNLHLGDWNEDGGYVDDNSITNNRDRDIVLAKP